MDAAWAQYSKVVAGEPGVRTQQAASTAPGGRGPHLARQTSSWLLASTEMVSSWRAPTRSMTSAGRRGRPSAPSSPWARRAARRASPADSSPAEDTVVGGTAPDGRRRV